MQTEELAQNIFWEIMDTMHRAYLTNQKTTTCEFFMWLIPQL